ncbi:MAG: dTDP-4-dehydrorhamnose reductase [Lachnospiraceae bacterium]|nr:dTDP-4-dehydrorhamnose reductase [Lachnospiraceae bacterium]MCI9617510.1 dTDP-4-dehydrorhamnose reductase [Eubacterium sp.]
MKVLVTGVKGQLGFDVVNELEKRGYDTVGVDIEEMDITDKDSVSSVFSKECPDAVIHCAAWTAVDAAEEEENIPKVFAVNTTGTEYIAEECKKNGAKLLFLSTDYVFDGQGEEPWKTQDERNPLNVYGQSKAEAEIAIQKLVEKYFIVRISWVFGKNGKNFIKTMLNLGKAHDRLTVVDDQIGSPTYTYDLARLLVDMAESDKYGIYHAANEGEFISWYDFAVEIMKQAGKIDDKYNHVEVVPVGSEQYPAKAKRPSNSRMAKGKLKENGFEPLPTWQDAVARYICDIME